MLILIHTDKLKNPILNDGIFLSLLILILIILIYLLYKYLKK